MAWEAHNGTQANRTIAAMLAGLGCVVFVIVVPGASAVPANLESAGAAHFDPWAEDLIAAFSGAMPLGGAPAQKPTSNFDGLISIKAACDWAKLTDTGTGNEPK